VEGSCSSRETKGSGGGGRLRNGVARRALTGRGRTAATLGQSLVRRRGSGGGKPTRRTPGRWGKSVRRSSMDERDERRAGEKNRPVAGGSLLRGQRGTAEGGPGSGDAMWHWACGAWLRPIGGVPTAARPRRASVSAVAR
jgi:hypothetical protein